MMFDVNSIPLEDYTGWYY